MKCQICGREYIALGVHVVVKHGVSTEDYRREFGLMKTTPLVDVDLSQHLSKMAKITFFARSADEKDEIRDRCKKNTKLRSYAEMSDAAKSALASRNQTRNVAYLTDKAEEVTAIIEREKSVASVYKNIGMSRNAVIRMKALGLINYDKTEANIARLDKVAKTIDERRAPAIAKLLELHNCEMNNIEICKIAEVPYTTYKKWVKAGLLPRRKWYRNTINNNQQQGE